MNIALPSPSSNTPCCLSFYLRNLLKLYSSCGDDWGRECMRRTDENEEDSKAGEVDNMRWMFMRASSTKTFHRAPFLAVCRIRTRRAAARATSGAAADLVNLPSESDLCVLPMNHLSRVVRRRIDRPPGFLPPLILFLFRQPPTPS